MISKLIVPLLALAFAGCVMALLVVVAKLQNEKERRWDEISRTAGLENEIERMRAREQCTAKAVLWYAEQLADAKEELDLERQYFCNADAESAENYQDAKEARMKCVELQDRLSSILCPSNNHIWKDGVCAKCGRVKDALP